MRILFVTPYVPSPIRVRSYHFLTRLAARHEVTALTLWQTEREWHDLAALGHLCPTVPVHLGRAQAVTNCLRGLMSRSPLQAAYCHSTELNRLIRGATSRQATERTGLPMGLQPPYDVVHVEHVRASRVGPHVDPAMPTLFDSVDCISLLLERTARLSHSPRQRALSLIELGRMRAYEAGLLSRFDRVIATSAEDASALSALAPGREVRVVRNGVDFEFFRPSGGTRASETIVLSGKMSYHANVSAALHFVRQIFPLIRQKRPNARLVIVGSDPSPAVRRLAVDPAISVTGHLPDIRGVLGRATVAVCPVTVKVGIQNKVLEAMAMGVPVVSSREGLEGLDARPGQDLLVAENPREFAGLVDRILADPRLAERVGSAGRRYVETNHRWDDAVRDLEELYEEAIDDRARLLGVRHP